MSVLLAALAERARKGGIRTSTKPTRACPICGCNLRTTDDECLECGWRDE
jgi:anaerobic ribonucleoside-triphosphate reductase